MSLTIWLRLALPPGEADSLRAECPDVTFVEGSELADEQLAAVDAGFFTEMVGDDVIERMPALKWLHSTYGGAGSITKPPVVARGILASSSRGVHAVPFSEFTVAAIYSWAKRFPEAVRAQERHVWAEEITETIEIEGKTLGLMGLGAIGSAVARKMNALGMRVIATRLHPEMKPDYVEWVGAPDAFPDLLRESDVLVLSVPATEATKGLIDEAALRAMKPTSYLINLVARNAIADEAILARALNEGWIAGAASNVFDGPQGVIRDDSPLWDAPNFFVSPRLAGLDPRKWERTRTLFAENVRRFMAGETLINLANPETGN